MSSKIMKTAVAVFFVLFILALGSIVIFGKINTAYGMSPSMFRTVFFVFVLVVLGTVYISNTDLLTTKLEHAFIVVAIFVFAISTAVLAGSIKNINDHSDIYISGTGAMSTPDELNSYYAQQLRLMTAQEQMIKDNNRALETEIQILNGKLSNKTPVIIETVVTIPGEIIYEEEPATVVPVVRPRYEEEDYEEDD